MSNKNTQHNSISCAKFTKKYDLEYNIDMIENKNIPVKNIFESSQFSIKSIFTIIATVISVLLFCFNIYKEYSQTMTDIKILNSQISTQIKQIDEKYSTLLRRIELNEMLIANKKSK